MAITTAQFATNVAEILTAQGVALNDATAFAEAYAVELTEWLGGADAIPADLSYRLTAVLGNWSVFVSGMVSFLTLPANGGDNGDGSLSVVDQFGVTHTFSSLAKLAEDLIVAQDALQGVDQLLAAATAAAASATAAGGSATSAAGSLASLTDTLAAAVESATAASAGSAAAAGVAATTAEQALAAMNDGVAAAVSSATSTATGAATAAAASATAASGSATAAAAAATTADGRAGDAATAATNASQAQLDAEAARNLAEAYRDQAAAIAGFDPGEYALKTFAKRQAKRAALIYGS